MFWNIYLADLKLRPPFSHQFSPTDMYNSFCFVSGKVKTGKKERRRVKGMARWSLLAHFVGF